ncbi:MAG: peptide chain release factor N(5)-glutamine methyltransferase [Acidobacteriota bacterium]
MKVFEALERAVARLEAQAIPHARLDAELLLSGPLRQNRSYLLAHQRDELPEEIVRKFFDLLLERESGKPLQYILGRQEFYGLDFEVSPAVLIPRPETELVVEEALRRFSVKRARVVDVGTGSGCIAVALAVHAPETEVFAVDLSAPALEVARRNADKHCVAGRVHLAQADLLTAFRLTPDFDGVVSNPPYVADSDVQNLQREVRDWEPRLALTAGARGLAVYQDLIPQAWQLLKPGGVLILEIGYTMRETVCRLMRQPWARVDVREDLSGIPRVVIAEKKSSTAVFE